MSAADEHLTTDAAHVLLDALASWSACVEQSDANPWETYEGEEDDPKRTEEGYLTLLGQLKTAVTSLLDGSPSNAPFTVLITET